MPKTSSSLDSIFEQATKEINSGSGFKPNKPFKIDSNTESFANEFVKEIKRSPSKSKGSGLRTAAKVSKRVGDFAFKAGAESLGILGGAKLGIAAGAPFGPVGMGVGGLLGGGLGAAAANLGAQTVEKVTGIKQDDISLKESAITGGLAVAAGPIAKAIGLAGKVVEKGATKAAKALGSTSTRILSALRGVSDDTARTFLKNPDKVVKIEKLGGIEHIARETTENLSKARSSFVKNTTNQIKKIVDKHASKEIDIRPILKKYKDIALNLAAEGDSGSKPLLKEVNRLNSIAKKTGGKLTAPQLFRQKGLAQEAADFVDPTKAAIGRSKAGDRSLRQLAGELNKKLDSVDPSIRELNGKIAELIQIEKKLPTGFGLSKQELTPEKIDKLLVSIGGQGTKRGALNSKDINKLQEILKVDLQESADLYKAIQELNQGNFFSAIHTGKGLAAVVTGGLVGGPQGAGALAILGSPEGFRAALRAGRVTGRVMDAFTKLPGIPDRIVNRVMRASPEAKGLIIASFLESPAGRALSEKIKQQIDERPRGLLSTPNLGGR